MGHSSCRYLRFRYAKKNLGAQAVVALQQNLDQLDTQIDREQARNPHIRRSSVHGASNVCHADIVCGWGRVQAKAVYYRRQAKMVRKAVHMAEVSMRSQCVKRIGTKRTILYMQM